MSASYRFNLEFTKRAKRDAETLQKLMDAASLTETIRRALAAQTKLQQLTKGERLILRDAEGNETFVVLI